MSNQRRHGLNAWARRRRARLIDCGVPHGPARSAALLDRATRRPDLINFGGEPDELEA
jgi:hypothetical protein